MTEEDFRDLQGLVRFGYRNLTRATYALLRVREPSAARAWLRTAEVTGAEWRKQPPQTALHVALTAPGLRALGVAEEVVNGFSHEFRGGMTQESRARQLGDLGANAPEHWAWGKPGEEPHLVVMFFGEPAEFEAFLAASKGPHWGEAFLEMAWLGTSDLDEAEPFGFKDGISQPAPDWEQQRPVPRSEASYTNLAALGEFVLGYRNEYGKYTERPLVKGAVPELPEAEETPGHGDLGRNGTYLVFRDLQQDVRGFWRYLYGQSGGDAAAAETLGAAFVGRTRAGAPLVPLRPEPIPGIDAKSPLRELNQFDYEHDPAGSRCPFGAHVRRANPRTADFPRPPAGLLGKLITMLGFGPRGFRDDLMSSVRFHRILRRGREYGPSLTPAQALEEPGPGEPARGLHFIGLNASLSRQFEFLQNAWFSSARFSGLTGESDPLLGNRQPLGSGQGTAGFTIQREGALRRRLEGLAQFVTVRGGAYFFLPGRKALRYLAREPHAPRA